MKIATAVIAIMGAFAVSVAQPQSPAVQQVSQSTPLYSVTMVARTAKAINYGHLSGGTRIDFRGTVLLPMAKGHANVETRRGAVRIQAQFDKLQPATQFGPEYLTYVLWAITPAGRANNLGEVQLQGGKSKLEVTAELQAFALVVTAEPYFAVIQPSDVVVMENVVRPDTMGSIEEIDAKYDLLQKGQYSSISADFQPVSMDPRVPLALYEARNALKIARGAAAAQYAADTFSKADQLLREAESYHVHHGDKKRIEMSAREAVQTAEDARAITVKRREEERLAMERKAAAEREARAKAEAEEAAKRSAQAEVGRREAERAKLEAELATERARLQAELAAERAARERADADASRVAAYAQQQAALAEAEKARQSAAQSERLRLQAEAEKAELRQRLLSQLSLILQTRDSVRGLIVNMSDVLFDSGSYTLRAAARQKLAKISGIVLAYPGLKLQVEGHTDSVGRDDFNQLLSEQRATAVRDFLVLQGVPADSVTARGFGKTQPVTANETAEGRQQNRRVELVVTGDAIGTSTVARSTGQ